MGDERGAGVSGNRNAGKDTRTVYKHGWWVMGGKKRKKAIGDWSWDIYETPVRSKGVGKGTKRKERTGLVRLQPVGGGESERGHGE